LQVLHIFMISQCRSWPWACNNSWCHNPIVRVVSIIVIRVVVSQHKFSCKRRFTPDFVVSKKVTKGRHKRANIDKKEPKVDTLISYHFTMRVTQ